ncbi:MAG: ATP-binding protein [Candidatus Thiodiazotropha lotti]|uniref:histidine kinase n=1 Tax=Candidatus Thiodiazotropha endoloripes TaxID=1818881 RepID=A0A1E2US62_9GAMM|nr:ATP-binding protein [Candidatus Thiodiazotropha endoloripes]MCG7897494.1 ATP-binding protein [Candidatus Thiodiazotropha weberae]MCG7990252.1 ATP-binding protein [Candidatus Thiodiazotropha lotti]MCG7902078.1 ATP-binding protein [Candidatus Thiodiazotropha weberae]MCG7914051.1 ATP-binding protein [Candidatus Thiodiazotropha weberae]MCG7999111.1 ATP-binding protein [Candidatus Thiodiazotropha lotti]
MNHELWLLFGISVVYLAILFLIAFAADSGRIPERFIRHPSIYVLSLGVYATSWTYYGSVSFAETQGYLFLTIYLGVTLAFALTPILFQPILRLTREYQLTSLADLFAFRYRSQLAGILVTLFMLLGTLPYIALQIRAVTDSLQVASQTVAPRILALIFCSTLVLFAILFGARHSTSREKHRGLVLAIAFESMVKLVAMLVIGATALFGVFGGFGGLEQWLADHPEALDKLYAPVREGPWATLILLAFAAAFLLPRQFHMLFTENLEPKALRTASWAFPLFLLLINLPIPIILWAGKAIELPIHPDFFALGISLEQGPSWLPVLAFIGGVSSASAMMIITTLALSSMTLNHILLPTNFPDPAVNLYRWLLLGRRLLIALIIMAGYGFYILLEKHQGLVQLGLISFVAVAQFLPGVVGLLYWRRATRMGFILGLLAGIAIWSATLLLPLLENSGFIRTEFDIPGLRLASGMDQWEFATFWSLALNTLLFVFGSLLSKQSLGEKEAANACCSESLVPMGGMVSAGSTAQFTKQLAQMLGHEAAQREVEQALRDLSLTRSETRPSQLRRLRERIERNLSGLLGPQLAHMIINRRLQLDIHTQTALADSMRFIEDQLEHSRTRLRGLSADLDNLRRYHRQILLDLPLGVCTIDRLRTVTIWNLAMEVMTGVNARDAIGVSLHRLPEPWGHLLGGFASAADEHIHHLEVTHGNKSRWFNLHKAAIPAPLPMDHPVEEARTSQVMLMEDLTDLETLEAELAHSERLASIGRLAAGVAHEIGNPVTGIASLAQNLRHEDDPELIKESINEILNQTQRITDIVKTLMNFSRSGGLGADTQSFIVHNVVEEAIRLVKLTHDGRQIRFINNCDSEWSIEGDRQAISQVLVNLLTNACHASTSGSSVEIKADEIGDLIRLQVVDQGVGISEENLGYLFEPFFTTKAPGEGTGLGLAIAYKIVSDHKGAITIDSEQGEGTRVIMDLPRNFHDKVV